MLFFILMICFLPSSTCSELLNREKRNWIIDSFEIEEANPGPFPYVLGKIEIERQYLVYFDLYGEGVDEEPKGVLAIDKTTGVIYVHKAVDYEMTQSLKLSFEARKNEFTIDTRLGVEIQIRDINDNPPYFGRDLYEITVNEDRTQGSPLVTVLAHDKDKRQTPNSTFHYNIKSVSPNSPDTEFFVNEHGLISFKGCLDSEVADKLTVLVEAIDHGDKVRLSSSTTVLINIQDGNNHLPVISGQTGSGKVKENESGTSPLRLHVTDKDRIFSKAWRAKYKIHNNNKGYFKIETDPETNDGILTVVKPMNYEENVTRELVISVENEMPYFFCKVKQKTTQGLWTVETNKNGKLPGDDGQPHSTKVIIQVEDVNDPPEFKVTIKDAVLEENAPIGTWVEKVTAVDPDSGSGKNLIYKIANDTAGWIKIDPNTGNITTVKIPDRESPHVVNGIYTVLLLAVDNGKPPMTGTATLNIHVVDVNDNLPRPDVGFVDICLSDSSTTTNLSASDADGDPYGGPFNFELLGSSKEKWKLKPSYGFTAGLVKEPSIQAGFYTIDLKISDRQGEYGVYSLNVTVCTCSMSRNCHVRASPTTSGEVAVVIAFLVLFLLLALLLAAFVMSCNEKKIARFPIQQGEESFQVYNIEKQGTDCKVEDTVAFLSNSQKLDNHDSLMEQNNLMVSNGGLVLSQGQMGRNYDVLKIQNHYEEKVPDGGLVLSQGQNIYNRNHYEATGMQQSWNNSEHYKRRASRMSSSSNKSWGYRTSMAYRSDDMETNNFLYRRNSVNSNALTALVQQRLSSLHDTETEMPDESHLYAEEGDANNLSDLEDIAFPDDDQESFQKVLENLGPSFRKLASICEPQQNHHKSLL